MMHARATGLLRLLLVAFALILVLLPFHAFLSTWGGTEIGPLLVWKSWKEILLAALIPLLVLYCTLRPDVAKQVWRGWLTKLGFLYVLLTTALAVVSQATFEAVAAGLLMNLRFLAIFVLAQVIVASGDAWVAKLMRWLEPWLLGTTIVLSVMAIAQVTIVPKDFLAGFGYGQETIAPYVLVDNNADALRGFATMRGPNPLGAYLILPLMLALLAVVREPRNLLAGLALGLGTGALVATGSRSAWLGALAAVIVMVALALRFKKFARFIAWSTVPALSLGVIVLWLAFNVPAVRLAVFHSSSGDSSLTEGSIDKHWEATANGAVDAWNHPFGRGVGTAGPASFYNTEGPPAIPENYFVQLAQEVGLAGVFTFIMLCLVLGARLWHRRRETWPRVLLASLVGITVVNLFLHGWSDDPTAMTWWGVAGLFALMDNGKVVTKPST